MTLRLLLILLSLAACSEEKAEKAPPPDDGCVGYIVKPDGHKECLSKK